MNDSNRPESSRASKWWSVDRKLGLFLEFGVTNNKYSEQYVYNIYIACSFLFENVDIVYIHRIINNRHLLYYVITQSKFPTTRNKKMLNQNGYFSLVCCCTRLRGVQLSKLLYKNRYIYIKWLDLTWLKPLLLLNRA